MVLRKQLPSFGRLYLWNLIMALAQFDPNTGLASYSTSLERQQVFKNIGNDCCCFLDPSTTAWDSGVIYSLGDLTESAGVTWRSLKNDNLGNLPSGISTYWIQVADTVSCGNLDWDSYPPYGGPGRTPRFYEVTVFFTWISLPCGMAFSTEILEQTEDPCVYNDVPGGRYLYLSPAHATVNATVNTVVTQEGIGGVFNPDLIVEGDSPCQLGGELDNYINNCSTGTVVTFQPA